MGSTHTQSCRYPVNSFPANIFNVSLENNILDVRVERPIEYSGVVVLQDKINILIEESERHSEPLVIQRV